jgi:hypothetical protein
MMLLLFNGGITMSKPRIYGKQSAYIPNAKADMRRCKKIYQRGREKAPDNSREGKPEKEATNEHR